MTSQLSPTPIFKAFDNNGFPLAFGLLTTYQAGTLTKQATYVDSTQTTQNTNPIQLNFRGECAIWLDPTLTYKFALTDQFGNTIPGWPVDNIPGGFGSGPFSVNLIPNPTNTFTLGSPTNSWAQIYLGANAAPAYDPVSGNIAYYARTAAEIAAGVTPTNYTYAPGYVERYGADPTGASDSGVAFRAACSVALQTGGGKIYALGAIYNFTTWDTVSFLSTNNLALFCLPGNSELVGGGMFSTKLRVSNIARVGMYASGANRTHIIGMRAGQAGQYVHDVQFDYNGIVQQSATDFCYFARTLSGGCTFQRCYGTQAPITNGIVDNSGNSGQRVIIRDCLFQDSGPNMTGNGALNSDCSYIYITAPNSIVESTLLFNSAQAVHNCGGIEMHSARYTVRSNMIRNCFPGMYLGVQDGVTTSFGSLVEGNYIGLCFSGIEIIDQHNGLKITKNHFEANIDSGGGGFGPNFGDIFTPINGTTGVNSAGTQTALSIVDNTFDMTAYLQGTARSGNASNSINLGTLQGCKIALNRFLSATPNAIIINGSSASIGSNGAAGATNDVTIVENDFIACTDATGTVGYINIFATSGASWGAGAVMQDIYVRNNHLWRTRSLSISSAFCLIATGGGTFTPTFNNVRWENNDLVNVNPVVDILGTGTIVIQNGQSATAQAITANGQTINTAAVTSQRIAPNAAYTGIIMQAGTVAGQQCMVMNESTTANSVTMAAAATSNVADGTSCVIAGASQKTFVWDVGTNLWYHS